MSQPAFVEDMIEEIVKKDPDARIISLNADTGEMEIDTELNLYDSSICQVIESDDDVSSTSLIDTQMVRDDVSGVNGAVQIRIIFTVFSVLSVVHFIAISTGILIYFVLLYDESKLVAIVFASINGTLMAVFYTLTAWQRRTELGLIFGIGLLTVRVFIIAALSRLIDNEILYMLEVVYLYQTAFLSIYTTKRAYPDNDDRREVQGWDMRILHNIRKSRYTSIAFYWLLATSTLVWVAGILLFIHVLNRELVWLWAILSYPMMMAVCVYKCRFIGNMLLQDHKRYSLTLPDRKRAVLEYYVDPLVNLWNKLMQI